MPRPTWRSFVLAALAIAFSAGPAAAAPGLSLTPVAGPNGTTPFRSPGGHGTTFVVSPPGDPHQVFVGTIDGYIYVINDGVLQTTPFLDIQNQVSTGNENGMFSMAFDPDYASNRWFYVDYSDTSNPDPKLDNYHLDAFQTAAGDADHADPTTQTQILEVGSTQCLNMISPHFGGQLLFGPDGNLWLTIGDGGDGGGDPSTNGPNCDHLSAFNATDLTSLHGKLLRIDPTPEAPPDSDGNRYTVPSTNPLVGVSGDRPEVWAYGLRNPYRFSFDSANGDLWIGDVGNSQHEEIDHVSSATTPGAPDFFGWSCMEGDLPFNFGGCDTPGAAQLNGGLPLPPAIAPVNTFDHNGNCAAVIGGLVLHDPALGGDYDGRYLYGYFCATTAGGTDIGGHLLTLDPANPGTFRDEGVGVGDFGLSSFGTDACDHPWVTDESSGLWQIRGAIAPTCGDPDTAITSAPSGTVATKSASVSFVAGEKATFACSLDGAPPSACSSPVSFTGLADGSHIVAVAATDAFGDTETTPAIASWTVDTTPPDIALDAHPPSLDDHSATTIGFHSNDATATFTCTVDGGLAQPCWSPLSLSGLADGPHTFAVTATDPVGNTTASPATLAWTVDTTPPDTTIAGGPSGITAATSATFTLSASEAGSTLSCSLDGGAAAPCAAAPTFSGLSDGSHTLSVVATDPAGNPDPTPATRSWTVDTTPPTVTIDSGPADSTSSSATIAFSAHDASALTLSCSIDGGAAQACAAPVQLAGLAPGAHSFAVAATDAAGNVGHASTTWSVLVAPAPPAPTPTPSPKPKPTSKLPPLKLSFRPGRTLRPTAGGIVTVGLNALSEATRGTLTVRHGSSDLVRPIALKLHASVSVFVEIGLSPTRLRALKRARHERVVISVSLTDAHRRTVHAHARFQLVAGR